ncbi:hypothetical protein BDC45DRAFT_533288 [Circinella umbellata]|nr:hypothetical protein BDC45DRAFT_533288 [Circinella umbellata]
MEPAAPKLFHDLGKLLREGKDVLDGILVCTLEDATAERATGWIIQICGLQGQISSLHLIRKTQMEGRANNIKVAIGRFIAPTESPNERLNLGKSKFRVNIL